MQLGKWLNLRRMAAGLMLCLTAPALGQEVSEHRLRWERAQAENQQFRRHIFERVGFAPIEGLTIAGREVRRLQLHDPYMMLPVPGIEIERHPSNRVTLRIQYWGWSSPLSVIDAGIWNALAADEEGVFERPQYGPPAPERGPPPAPPPVCHGWSAWIQADPERSAGWHACGGAISAAHRYALRMLEVAMATRPTCRFDRNDPFSSFQRCFSPSESLDDPQLSAAFSQLSRDYYAAPGADRLAEARRALQAPSLTLGSPAWREARAAIARFREVQDHQRQLLQRLRSLAGGARNASPADRARLRQAIESWADFLYATERNYAEVITRLAWAADAQ